MRQNLRVNSHFDTGQVIPVKKILGVFGNAAGGRSSSAGSSYTGNGARSFPMGFGRLFGGAGGGGAGNMHLNRRRFSIAGNREL